MKIELPLYFKPILWSYDIKQLDPNVSKQAIIINAINYGDLRHWRWLISYYGKKTVQSTLETIPVTTLRPRVRKLAELIFNVRTFNHAPRSAH